MTEFVLVAVAYMSMTPVPFPPVTFQDFGECDRAAFQMRTMPRDEGHPGMMVIMARCLERTRKGHGSS